MKIIALFILFYFFELSQVSAKKCCTRKVSQHKILDYVRAIRNKSREDLFDVLSEDFKLTLCDGRIQTRQQIYDEIKKFDVSVQTNHFIVQNGSRNDNGTLKFTIDIFNNGSVISENYFEARFVGEKLILMSEKQMNCLVEKTITTNLVDEKNVGKRLAHRIIYDYSTSLRSFNKSYFEQTVTSDFAIDFCNKESLNSTNLMDSKNQIYHPRYFSQSDILQDQTVIRDDVLFFYILDSNITNIFESVFSQGKYRLKKHHVMNCTDVPNNDLNYREIAKEIFYKYCLAINLTSLGRFSEVVPETFSVTYLDGSITTLTRRDYFYKTISYQFYQPNYFTQGFHVLTGSNEKTFTFKAAINEENIIEFEVEKINGTFLIVSENHLTQDFRTQFVDRKSLGNIPKSQAMEDSEDVLARFHEAIRQENSEKLFNVISESYEIRDSDHNLTIITPTTPDIFKYFPESVFNYKVVDLIHDGFEVQNFYAEDNGKIKEFKTKYNNGILYLLSEEDYSEKKIKDNFYESNSKPEFY